MHRKFRACPAPQGATRGGELEHGGHGHGGSGQGSNGTPAKRSGQRREESFLARLTRGGALGFGQSRVVCMLRHMPLRGAKIEGATALDMSSQQARSLANHLLKAAKAAEEGEDRFGTGETRTKLHEPKPHKRFLH